MISLDLAIESHVDGGRNRAAVCSMPPSEVGLGIMASDFTDNVPVIEGGVWLGKGRK